MTDQASELRNLIRAGDVQRRDGKSAAQMVVVSGGKPGVGTTTLATNLAATLALDHQRVVLVDADLLQGGVCKLCGLKPLGGVSEMFLTNKSDADRSTARPWPEELLQEGAAGIQVLSGMSETCSLPQLSGSDEQRFVSKLRQLGQCFDYIVVDSGNGVRGLTRSLWKSADHVLVVTTPDAVSIMDSYAAIKTMRDSRESTPVSIVVNQTSSPSAVDVYERLGTACDRFLGQSVKYAGNVPLDAMLAVAAQMQVPFVVQAPTASATQSIRLIIANLRNEPYELHIDVAS